MFCDCGRNPELDANNEKKNANHNHSRFLTVVEEKIPLEYSFPPQDANLLKSISRLPFILAL